MVSALFIIDSQKQKLTKNWKAKVNPNTTFDWESNNKLYDQTLSFVEKLEDDFKEISKQKENELKEKIFKEISDFKTALGLHYNFFDQLFVNNEIENNNIKTVSGKNKLSIVVENRYEIFLTHYPLWNNEKFLYSYIHI